MSSERYYTISFNNSLYVTDDGTSSGDECRLIAQGQHALETEVIKTKSVDFRGKPKFLKSDIGLQNRNLELRIERLPKTVGNSLLALRLDQDETDTLYPESNLRRRSNGF